MGGSEGVGSKPGGGSGKRRAKKYENVRDRVMDLVAALEVGAAIPPERDLVRRLDVSRLTVRRAVDNVVAQGYLVRRQGSGTFVAEPKISQSLTMTSFSEDMRARGLEPSSRTLGVEDDVAGEWLARRTGLEPECTVLKVRRLRLADGEPMALENLYVPRALVPGLSGEDLAGASFYELLRRRYGVLIGSGRQSIEPTVVRGSEAEVLNVGPGLLALLFERTTRSTEGEIVEFVRSVYRGDRYKFTVDLSAPGTRSGSPDGAREGLPGGTTAGGTSGEAGA